MALLAALVSAGIYSCGDDGNDKSPAGQGANNTNEAGKVTGNTLVGIWVDKPESSTYNAFVFLGDGTGYFKDHGYSSKSEYFRYALSGNKVIVTWVDEGSGDGRDTYRYEITNNGNTLLLYEEDPESGEELEFIGYRQQSLPGESSNNNQKDDNNNQENDSISSTPVSLSSIVGIWVEHPESTDYDAIVFRADGTGYWKEGAYDNSPDEFRYVVSGNKVIFQYKTSYSGDDIEEFRYEIANNGNTLLLYENDSYSGEELEFMGTRMQSLPTFGGESDNTTYSVVGTWRSYFDDAYAIITISANGTGTSVTYGNNFTETETFTYALSGSNLYIKIRDQYSGSHDAHFRIRFGDNGNTLYLYEIDSYSGESLFRTLIRVTTR